MCCPETYIKPIILNIASEQMNVSIQRHASELRENDSFLTQIVHVIRIKIMKLFQAL